MVARPERVRVSMVRPHCCMVIWRTSVGWREVVIVVFLEYRVL